MLDPPDEESGDECAEQHPRPEEENGRSSQSTPKANTANETENGSATDLNSSTAPVVPPSEKLSELFAESLALLDSNGRHQLRKQQVTLLFTSAINVQKGIEDKGVDLSKVERARLAADARLFAPLQLALHGELLEYIEQAFTNLGTGEILDDKALEAAAAVLESCLYNVRDGLEQQRSDLEREREGIRERMRGPIFSEGEHMALLSKSRNLDDEIHTVERKLKATPRPRMVAGEFIGVAGRIDNAIKLVQDAPEDVFRQNDLMTSVAFIEHRDLVKRALSSLTPPASSTNISHWNSFVRKATAILKDRNADRQSCDASLLSDTLDGSDIDALRRAATLLKRVAADCKAAQSTPLAVPLEACMRVDAPPETAVEVQSWPEDKTCVSLPSFDAIKGSTASVLLLPSMLFNMPREYLLRLIAEKAPLPSLHGSTRLAEQALPDVLRLLDGFLATPKRGESTTTCPFRAYGEMLDARLDRLIDNVRAAARFLRGEAEPMEPVEPVEQVEQVEPVEPARSDPQPRLYSDGEIREQQARWDAESSRLGLLVGLSTGAENSFPELAALYNAARALVKCRIDELGQIISQLPTLSKDNKRLTKLDMMRPTHHAPTQQLSRSLVQSGSTEVAESLAATVLKTIASKAGLEVNEIVNNVSKPEGSTANGKRTTKRHKFIEIWHFDQLVNVAGVVREAIAIFRDKTRTADQKGCPLRRECPKRKRS